MAYNIGIETSPVRSSPSRSGSSGKDRQGGERPLRYSAALEEPAVPRDGFWSLSTKGGLLSPRKDQELEQLRTRGCVHACVRCSRRWRESLCVVSSDS